MFPQPHTSPTPCANIVVDVFNHLKLICLNDPRPNVNLATKSASSEETAWTQKVGIHRQEFLSHWQVSRERWLCLVDTELSRHPVPRGTLGRQKPVLWNIVRRTPKHYLSSSWFCSVWIRIAPRCTPRTYKHSYFLLNTYSRTENTVFCRVLLPLPQKCAQPLCSYNISAVLDSAPSHPGPFWTIPLFHTGHLMGSLQPSTACAVSLQGYGLFT